MQILPPIACGPVCLRAILGLLLLAQTGLPVRADSTPTSPAAIHFDAGLQILTVSTLDRQWALELTPKRLLGKLNEWQSAMLDLPQFFDGKLVSDPDSWVRITFQDIDDGVYTGHVFSDGELYELQYHDELGGHVLAQLPAGLTLKDMVLPDAPDPIGESTTSQKDQSSNSLASSSPVATRAIRIGVAVDSRYNEHYDQRGLAHALSIINGVDGLYQEQLNLAVIVDGFRIYDDPQQDPLRDFAGNIDQILGRYRDLRIDDEQLPADLALVHLFSGLPDPDKIIGLGWIDTVCRLDGYDLSLSTPFPYDMLLAAHEIAHNLGAEHDDNAACSSDGAISGSEIMWPQLSDSTRPAFSACSLNSMQPALNASCVLDNIDVGMQITATPTGLPDQLAFTVSAYNNDEHRVAPSVSSSTDFPTGTRLLEPSSGCSISGTQLTCRHSTLQPGGHASLRSVIVEFVSNGSTYPLVSSELRHGGFTDTEQLDNQATLRLDDPQFGLNNVTFARLDDLPDSLPAAEGGTVADQLSDDILLPSAATMSGGSAGAGSEGPLSLLIMGLFSLWPRACVRRARRIANQ